jgi:PTH1 family peptidyl-tRNA hydrolase
VKPSIRLIVGLGNPGEKYIGTRHNAGADFVSAVAKREAIELKTDKKLAGRIGRGMVNGQDVRLPDSRYLYEPQRKSCRGSQQSIFK